MAHPLMFAPDDPMLARVRQLALAFPGSSEKISHGRPAFYTTKVFAYYGGSVKVAGAWVEHAQALLVLPDASERTVLLTDTRVFVPGYLGASGWLGFDLDPAPDVWRQAAELLDSSYRNTAPTRLVAQLNSRANQLNASEGGGGSVPDQRCW